MSFLFAINIYLHCITYVVQFVRKEVSCMLFVNNLKKSYHDVKAVDSVSFFVDRGEVAILVGPNGAGKSTTIQSIVGILRYEGDIRINDHDSRSLEAKSIIAYVPEIPSMFPLLSVREHVEYMARAYGKEVSEDKIDALLSRFELLDKQEKLGDALSKGMMQKVSICCALVVDPEVIILDEPMVGLDPKAIKELKKVVLELREQGKTIIISTHMMEMVDTLWDRIILMKQGKILTTLVREDVGDRDLESLFFELTEGNIESLPEGVSNE